MYNRVFHIAIPVMLMALFTACGCSPTGSTEASSRRAIEELFPGSVLMQPMPRQEGGRELSDGTLVRIADVSGETLGYAAELQVVSRSGPFPILVVLDVNRCVREVRILRYTARRGRGVLSQPFASQFHGKGARDPVRIGRDIDAVTGATLSSRAVAGGVRHAIELAAQSVPE